MKKLIPLCSLSLILLTLCSCAQFSLSPSVFTPATPSVISPGDNTSQVQTDTMTKYFTSLEEFQKYILSNKLSNIMVAYEPLKALGSFSSVVLMDTVFIEEPAQEPQISHNTYLYNLVDPCGLEIMLQVSHLRKEINLSPVWETLLESDINPKDMRTLSTEITGFYCYNGITYWYSKGKLHLITWETDNVDFCLMTSGSFADYPIPNNTTVSRMLSLETATDVIASIVPKKS